MDKKLAYVRLNPLEDSFYLQSQDSSNGQTIICVKSEDSEKGENGSTSSSVIEGESDLDMCDEHDGNVSDVDKEFAFLRALFRNKDDACSILQKELEMVKSQASRLKGAEHQKQALEKKLEELSRKTLERDKEFEQQKNQLSESMAFRLKGAEHQKQVLEKKLEELSRKTLERDKEFEQLKNQLSESKILLEASESQLTELKKKINEFKALKGKLNIVKKLIEGYQNRENVFIEKLASSNSLIMTLNNKLAALEKELSDACENAGIPTELHDTDGGVLEMLMSEESSDSAVSPGRFKSKRISSMKEKKGIWHWSKEEINRLMAYAKMIHRDSNSFEKFALVKMAMKSPRTAVALKKKHRQHARFRKQK